MSRRMSAPTRRLPDAVRIYAIGDIHGRLDLLEDLAGKIRSDIAEAPPARTAEIFLGDYIDRGPRSREVVDWLMGAPTNADERICLLGNHEDMLLKALDDRDWMSNWLFNGGPETLLSYNVKARALGGEAGLIEVQNGFRAALPGAHLEFYAGLRRYVLIEPYLFVHAGIRPGRTLAEQDPEELIWIRGPFLESDDDFGFVVVHGHTPSNHPEVRPNRINIDTGAVFSGCLTCVVLEGDTLRFIQAASI